MQQFRKLAATVRPLLLGQAGQSLSEYSLITALVIIGCIIFVAAIGGLVVTMFDSVLPGFGL